MFKEFRFGPWRPLNKSDFTVLIFSGKQDYHYNMKHEIAGLNINGLPKSQIAKFIASEYFLPVGCNVIIKEV